MTTTQRIWILAAVVFTGWLVYLLAPVLMPFLVSALLAYMADPLVDKLENWHLPRGLAVLLVFLLVLIGLAVFFLLVVPALVREIADLVAKIPVALAWLQAHVVPWLNQQFGLDLQQFTFDSEKLAGLVREYFASISGVAAGVLTTITKSGSAIVLWLINLFLIPLITFYLLRDWDALMSRIESGLPRRHADTITSLAEDCDAALAGFLRGQLLVMLSLGAFYSVALWLIGLNNPLAIGSIAGLVSFVPYLGPIIGVLLAGITAVLQSSNWLLLVLVGAVFAAGQVLESFFLTPKLVGDRIGLHPVLVIFAVMAGGQLFGFTGVLLALPAAAAANVLIRFAWRRYLDSSLYDHENETGTSVDLSKEP
ncbi:MAG TPA: AI-2E family transporter [Gammaproteobacteria bacterium]|nr:AI-2E family transporter [Gammaproteobacteria bacterium]